MYSIQKAAEILGKSESTLRRWMKHRGIQMVAIETDRRRVYIADDDMDTLVDHITQKVLKNDDKTREHHRNKRDVITTGEGKYYSFAGAASLLGISVITVKRWVKQDHIAKKHIITKRLRAYISCDDVLRLAELHRRKLSPKALAEMNIQREVNAIQPDMDKLCSLKEAASYLDVTYSTLRNWIRQDNIEQKTNFIGRDIACIPYRDILRLAELHRREIVPNPSSLTVKEEIKEIQDELAKLAADVEALKHDFRVYVKRSIYIG